MIVTINEDDVILLPVKVKGETSLGSGNFWVEVEGTIGLKAVPGAVLIRAQLLKTDLVGARSADGEGHYEKEGD